MKSRLDRYDNNVSSSSRVSKNQTLYDDIYSNTNYSNMVVLDNSNEVDIRKIKEIIDNQNSKSKRVEKNSFNIEEYDNLVPMKTEEKKLYDINEVLKEAKNQRNIIEEANEKRKFENYKFRENLDEELSKTRKVYENLIKEEKELLSMMNTLTNVSKEDIANDMFSELKDNDSDFTEVLNPSIDNNEDVSIKQINDDTTEYSTDTFMFNTKDFEGLDEMRKNVKNTSMFIKTLTAVLVFAILIILIIIIIQLGK